MKIGELSRRTAVSERSLRYYEEQGLLEPERTPGGHRTYAEWAVDRVIHIQELYAAGLPSTQIRELLPCMRATTAVLRPRPRPGSRPSCGRTGVAWIVRWRSCNGPEMCSTR